MDEILKKALELGAHKAKIIDAKSVPLDASFRSMCATNACGKYGKNYKCPPHVGEIETLMQKIRSFNRILVYQTVSALEDSYDFEGMQKAGVKHNQLAQALIDVTTKLYPTSQFLHLGAGGCKVCDTCGLLTNEPCRYPSRAIGSLEAHGVNVSKLAEIAEMKYINGQNTVTYFGAILF